jgi:serine O-acetyltransferase
MPFMSSVRSFAETVRIYRERDPAARSALEVILCYPGLHALLWHAMAHRLWGWGLTTPGRFVAHIGRWLTGIEIHPAARIGRRLVIDHGMGVVIGETAVVGNDVTLYQGVTLGGTGSDHVSRKRHPTLCDGVFVGNNANVLGDIRIGENSRVGAGSVVLRDVPPNSTVVGVPAHIVYRNGQRILITDPHEVKDPLSDALIALADRVEKLEATVGQAHAAPHTFMAEDEEREAYRQEIEQLRDYVSMGEGI